MTSTHASDDFDPFDIENLREESLMEPEVERVLTTIPVRRPKRNEFFRVHPDPLYVVDGWVVEHEEGFDRSVYWVAGNMRTAQELANDIRKVRLHVCISRLGTVFIWPARLPSADANTGRSWHVSALEVAEAAKKLWIKMVGNRDLGAYEQVRAKGNLPEPQWPDKDLKELIKIAFKGDGIIMSPDHPVVQAIVGEL